MAGERAGDATGRVEKRQRARSSAGHGLAEARGSDAVTGPWTHRSGIAACDLEVDTSDPVTPGSTRGPAFFLRVQVADMRPVGIAACDQANVPTRRQRLAP